MTNPVKDIRAAIDEYKRTTEGDGLHLRLSLAQLLLHGLRQKGWTQRDLAREANVKESFVSRVLHSNANCTFDTAAKLLRPLELDARLEGRSTDFPLRSIVTKEGRKNIIKGVADAQEKLTRATTETTSAAETRQWVEEA